jgi:hypothetical protein
MNLDDFPLSAFEVDCDGSACGSGPCAGLHVHPPQDADRAIGRVTVREGRRAGYSPATGISRPVTSAEARTS